MRPPSARRLLAAAALAAVSELCFAAAAGAAEEAPEPSCPAGTSGGACAGKGGGGAGAEYYWPHARGVPGRYASTTLLGPTNLTASVAWTWQHPERHIMPGASLLDGARNIYVPVMDGIRKFSPDGNMLWFYRSTRGFSIASPSIMGGVLYGSTFQGFVFALDMETGAELWAVQQATNVEMDTPYVEASDGMVFAIFDKQATPHHPTMSGNTKVVAMRASDGKKLWEYKSERILWNFMPQFVGDGTFITMDIHGGAYRIAMRNGTVLWHAPPPAKYEPTFTDGGVILGPGNRVAYTCSNMDTIGMTGKGALRAYSVGDGRLLWDRELPHPCVSWPAVGADNRTVVVPVGGLPIPVPPAPLWIIFLAPLLLALFFLHLLLCAVGCATGKRCRKARSCCCGLEVFVLLALCLGVPALHQLSIWLDQQQIRWIWGAFKGSEKPLGVLAFDAHTGDSLWHFKDIPVWGKVNARADEEDFAYHMLKGHFPRPVCGPASWSAPTVDGRGTVYAGAMNGILYAIRDANGDGHIDSATEVSTLDTGAASLHGGASFAPGMMAYATCNRLYVFRT